METRVCGVVFYMSHFHFQSSMWLFLEQEQSSLNQLTVGWGMVWLVRLVYDLLPSNKW